MKTKWNLLYHLLSLLITLALALIFITSLLGCASKSTPTLETLKPVAITAQSSDPTTISQAETELTFFPVQKAGYEALAYPAALTSGTLVLDHGYLRLATGTDPAGQTQGLTLIWPPGSTFRTDNNSVLNQAGRPIAKVGEILRVGGGEVPVDIVTKYTGQTLPSDCPGPYWLAAPGVYDTPAATNKNNGPTLPVMDDAFKAAMEKEPLLLDATIYAQQYGISVDGAIVKLKLQDAFTGLGSALENNEAATFGGLWIQHEPQYRIVVAFTRDGEETLKKYSAYINAGASAYIEVSTVKYTLAQLQQTQSEIGIILVDLHLPYSSAVDIMQNRVVITMAESIRNQIAEAIRNGALKVPDNVSIQFGDTGLD